MIVNVHVEPFDQEPVEFLIKRFLKKCKKEQIVRCYCERTEFKTNRQKKQEKQSRHRARLRKKRRRR